MSGARGSKKNDRKSRLAKHRLKFYWAYYMYIIHKCIRTIRCNATEKVKCHISHINHNKSESVKVKAAKLSKVGL